MRDIYTAMQEFYDEVDDEADRFERRYDCDRCRDTGRDGDRPCRKCDAYDLGRECVDDEEILPH